MKSFVILICVGMAIAGDDMFGEEKLKKQWMEYKSFESCFGENMMKTSMLKMKKAVVKCTGMDMPELDLPMFKSPHRVVHALLEGAEDLEQMKVLNAFQKLQQHGQSSQQQQAPALQLVLGQQQAAPQQDMMSKMMMKMMFKKMFKGSHGDMNENSPFGNLGSKKFSFLDQFSQGQDNEKYEMFKQMLGSFGNSRERRAVDDVFELGDRLTEKLKTKTKEMQAKLGNASCILEELNIIDQNQNIDITGMVQSVKNGEWGEFPDEWIKEHHIKDCQNCATYANSIPQNVFDECAYGEKWGRIVLFFGCEKEAKYKTCMNHDMKLKLEKSFGSLEELEQATGLPEYQLLPLTMKLLHEQMDMFM